MRNEAIVLLTLAVLVGCTETHVVARELPNGVSDGATVGPATNWGDFAATLAIAACPAGLELLVDTEANALDGGSGLTDPADAGPTLSFREAMTIAYNRDGAETIRFAPEVFAADAARAIELPCMEMLAGRQTCIDARNRGVILRWPEACPSGGLQLIEGSMLVGVAIEGMPLSLNVVNSTIAGCRLNTDGDRVINGVSFFDVNARGGAQVGPGNVVVGRWGIGLYGTAASVHAGDVIGNYLGMDPITGRELGLTNALETGNFDEEMSASIRENVFMLDGPLFVDPSPRARIDFRSNWLGQHPDGVPLSGATWGVTGLTAGTFSIERNVIRGASTAAVAVSGATVRISANSIFGSANGIVFDGAAPVEPPTITMATADGAQGTCPQPGTVELFSDVATQGEQFIGTAACDGTWSLTGAIPRGRNATATLTVPAGHTSAFSDPAPVP